MKASLAPLSLRMDMAWHQRLSEMQSFACMIPQDLIF